MTDLTEGRLEGLTAAREIEAVARALCANDGYDPDYAGTEGAGWTHYSAQATVAIRAIADAKQSETGATPNNEATAKIAPDGTVIIEDAKRPGIELLHLQGPPGYHDEFLHLSNGLNNGLRLEIRNEIEEDGFDHSSDWMSFHFQSPNIAKAVATRLLEWADRIADPSSPAVSEPARVGSEEALIEIATFIEPHWLGSQSVTDAYDPKKIVKAVQNCVLSLVAETEKQDDELAALRSSVRNPSEAMLNAAWDWSYAKYGKPIGNDAATGCWQAMFDARALLKKDAPK